MQSWWPLTADVAALITARTVDAGGNQLGDFTPDTIPSGQQVVGLIEQSAALVMSITGGQDLPVGVSSDAMRSLVALRTAMSVELSFFPEQVGTDSSPFVHLQSMYRDEFGRVTALVDSALGSDENGLHAGKARHTFPCPSEPLEF